jgi:glycosyltransferase involved in cell wall biosynthesis
VVYDTGRVCELRPMSAACVGSDCDRRNYGHKLWRVARQAVRAMLFNVRHTPPVVLAIHDGMRAGLERGGVPAHAIRVLRNPIRPFTTARIAAEDNNEAIFIGRLHWEKGADLAAQAARRAGVRLRIVGNGPMFDALARDYPDVILEGQRTQAEIAKLVTSARVLMMPSRYPEPFGLVAGEALWSGLPVILSDTAMIANEISTRRAGVACDMRSASALADTLRGVFADHAETRLMSNNAFHAMGDLGNTPSDWSDALMTVYRDLVAGQALTQLD